MSNSHSDENPVPEPALDPVRQKQARQYAGLKRRLSLVDLAIAGTLLLVFAFSGLYRELTGSASLPVVAAAVLYFAILMLVYGLLSAPLSYYRGFVLPRRYGLLTQKVSGWLGDTVKAAVLGLILGAAIIAAIYWFMTGWPGIWWLLTWGTAMLLSLVLTILAPVVIVPLFFDMKPLADAELKGRLEKMAEQAGVGIGGIYSIEFSGKSTTANAALMGLGRTRRIVLSDTLLERYPPAEIEVVMAHEMGHHRHNDMLRLFTAQAAILLISFYLTDLILKASVGPLGFAGISDAASLPLLMLIFGAVNLLLTPLLNSYSRRIEAAADGYALRLTKDARSFVHAMTRLTDQNLDEARPGRWVERLLYDHPSYQKRLAQANCYSARRAKGE